MRALRVLLIIAVILGGVFVALDRFAVDRAESEAADRIKLQQGTAGTTSVEIKGFPFLTQVVAKQLDEVGIELTGIEASAGGRQLRISEMSADLFDVTLGEGYSSATASRATGSARISYGDLTKASEEGVTLAYGQNGKVKVTGTVRALGQEITRSVLSTVTVVGDNTIRVRADAVPGEGIPGLEGLIRDRIDFERQLGGFPEGLKLEKLSAQPDGLVITVTGRDVQLAG